MVQHFDLLVQPAFLPFMVTPRVVHLPPQDLHLLHQLYVDVLNPLELVLELGKFVSEAFKFSLRVQELLPKSRVVKVL